MTLTARGLQISMTSVAFATFLGAGAAPAATYIGAVSSGLGGAVASDGGTTAAPASYTVGGGGDVATSVSSNINGGRVTSTATSDLLLDAASTKLEFRAKLVGPDGRPVPVRVVANGSATGTGLYATSSAYFTLEGFELVTASATYYHGQAGFLPSFAIDQTVLFTPNADFIVTLLALASAGDPFTHGPVSASASADPMFFIDPAFAADYHFEGLLSAAPSVPEPGAWALMIVGLGLVGLTARSHRARLAA